VNHQKKKKRCQEKVNFHNIFCDLKKKRKLLRGQNLASDQTGLKGTDSREFHGLCGGLLSTQNTCGVWTGVNASVPVSPLLGTWGCGEWGSWWVQSKPFSEELVPLLSKSERGFPVFQSNRIKFHALEVGLWLVSGVTALCHPNLTITSSAVKSVRASRVCVIFFS